MTEWEVVEVKAQWGVDDDRLLELLDELRLFARDVRIERYPRDVGGPGELYFVIDLADLLALGGLLYLKSFLETLASENAKGLVRKLMKVLQSGEAKQHYRRLYPLSVGADRVWFHICKPCSDDELRRRFRLASEVVEEIEGGTVSSVGEQSSGDDTSHFYYWSGESNSWKRMPVGEYGPELPDDAG